MIKIDEDYIKNIVSNILPERVGGVICNINKNDKINNKLIVTLIFIETITDEDAEKIKQYIKYLPDVENIFISDVDKKILTEMNLLRIIKILQPIEETEIIKEIKKDSFYYEDIKLKRMLDKLRKDNYIFRSSEETYFVTEKALSIIPHGNFKKSSDIARILEINKRKC